METMMVEMNKSMRIGIVLFGMILSLSLGSCAKKKVEFHQENEVILETRTQLSDFFFDSSLFITISASAPLEQSVSIDTDKLLVTNFLFVFQAVGLKGSRPVNEFEDIAVINFAVVGIVTEASKRGMHAKVIRNNHSSYNIIIGDNGCNLLIEVYNDGKISKLIVRN